MPRLPGFRRASDGESASPAPPSPRGVRRALPPNGQIRHERRALIALREARLRDLGGLMLEMFRRDQFRQELLVDRCTELVLVEERLAELEVLVAATSRGRARSAIRCDCGAPIFDGSKFCAQCGAPTDASPNGRGPHVA